MVWLIFNQNDHQIKTFISYIKPLKVKHKILPDNFCIADIYGPINQSHKVG